MEEVPINRWYIRGNKARVPWHEQVLAVSSIIFVGGLFINAFKMNVKDINYCSGLNFTSFWYKFLQELHAFWSLQLSILMIAGKTWRLK